MLILIDQDNVLADFETGFRAAWEASGHPHPALPPHARKSFYVKQDYPAHLAPAVEAIYTAPGFFRALPPLPGALAGIAGLLEAGHDVRICTSPLQAYHHCVTEKFEWVEHHLGLEFVNRIILTRDKTLVHGDSLIDDNPRITGARAPAWRHILYDQPYNRHVPGPRMTWAGMTPDGMKLDNWRDLFAAPHG
jgi:5'-nucleotidase